MLRVRLQNVNGFNLRETESLKAYPIQGSIINFTALSLSFLKMGNFPEVLEK